MKQKMLLCALLFIGVSAKVCAQYFDPSTSIIGNNKTEESHKKTPAKEGYTLDLDNGNKLFIPRVGGYAKDYTSLDLLRNVNLLLDSVQSGLEKLKDSLSDRLSSIKVQYVEVDGNARMVVTQAFPEGRTYYVSGGNSAIIKQKQDTIIIVKEINEKNNFRIAELIFSLNNISDFKKIIESPTVENFIDKIQKEIPPNIAKMAFYKIFVTGQYAAGADGNVSGSIKVLPNAQKSLTIGVSADIQNVKNYFAPSASVALQLSNSYRKNRGATNSFGLSWNPYFFFSKDATGKAKTYRNDFLFLSYSAWNTNESTWGKLNIYLPLSIGYLIHRRGDFLEKNTFALNAFGVKYGNATLKPYLYFNNFFRGVTPNLQLSIGFGK